MALAENAGFAHGEHTEAPNAADANRLVAYIQDVERITSLVAWWDKNRQPFVDSWTTLKGVADAEGKFPQRA